MIKYFCDFCEKECKREEMETCFNEITYCELYLCKDCYKHYQDKKEEILKINNNIKEKAMKEMKEVEKKILGNLKNKSGRLKNE